VGCRSYVKPVAAYSAYGFEWAIPPRKEVVEPKMQLQYADACTCGLWEPFWAACNAHFLLNFYNGCAACVGHCYDMAVPAGKTACTAAGSCCNSSSGTAGNDFCLASALTLRCPRLSQWCSRATTTNAKAGYTWTRAMWAPQVQLYNMSILSGADLPVPGLAMPA
jgi:hypothetical protein